MRRSGRDVQVTPRIRLSWAGRVGQVASDRSRRAGRAEQVAPSSSRPERPSVKGQLMAGSAKEVARFLSMYLNI